VTAPLGDPPSTVRLRPATVDDAEAIRAIYNLEVETSTATMDLIPRSLADQRQWLAERSGAFTAVVAVLDGPDRSEVAGFAALSPYRERAAYRTTVEDSVYVRRDLHGRGIGRLLLDEVLAVAEASGFHTVMARIEGGGVGSQALHAACGFHEVGVEREVARKFSRWLDVVIMQKVLAPVTRDPG
jgi:L-amino acid N-acyltransferase